ncbi:type I phosphomannose isomerase catalytic subunit [Halothermothrix orenii]|uniref:Phosphohexomutase n=1 Tax=Halothermothrix orenii (strain H 168 / OCM 544 / DSM 9562) TaxID=373903 RepID=B8D0G2_HALOH|nr:type I phosphomannose isomerase catalytic subunit [Halothermothrix orenii]ACL70898.1 mannose-6-phosphate isomerase, class I [Halothermothrix orenii H 168]
MELYPLKFKPVYKSKIWGGRKLKDVFNRDLPDQNIGESWEVAAHPNGTSIVANGSLKGQSLPDIINTYGDKITGEKLVDICQERFPLLIKLLDAEKKLSVQVHPDNDYAHRVENDSGKTEMWYIIDARPGARLVYGLKPGTTKEQLAKAIKRGEIEKYLNRVPVKKGDVFFMPSGTIHAIEEGILLAEIQQNSDTTYRVYDWDRVGQDGNPRPLHIEKALDVINFKTDSSLVNYKPLSVNTDQYRRDFLAACPYFVTEYIEVKDEIDFIINKFIVLMCLKGTGEIHYNNRKTRIAAGETLLIPAALEKIKIRGNVNFIKTFIPSSKSNVINELAELGFDEDKIKTIPGLTSWK